jgi:hypothetical protein
MKVIISFCNQTENNNSQNLKVLDIKTGKVQKINFDIPNVGITGLAKDEKYIYALYQETIPGIIILDRHTYELVYSIPLSEISDPHSLVVDKDNLYIVSTGNDSIFLYSYSQNQVIFKGKFWSPVGLSNADNHHLNSLSLTETNQLLVSAFGSKEKDMWHTANNGYIYDVSNSKYLIKNIQHPHSIFVYKNGIYYCESLKKKIKRNKSTKLILDKGYTRGLYVDDNYIVVGSSYDRKISKSTGKENILDINKVSSECKVFVYSKQKKFIFEKYELIKDYDFSDEHQEIYDILVIS